MKKFLVFVWRKHRVAGLVLAAALAAFLFFAVNFTTHALYFAHPANQERPLELWMSPRYVAQSWGLPRPVMFEIIGVAPDTSPKDVPKTVKEIIERNGLTLGELEARVEAAKAALEKQPSQ